MPQFTNKIIWSSSKQGYLYREPVSKYKKPYNKSREMKRRLRQNYEKISP